MNDSRKDGTEVIDGLLHSNCIQQDLEAVDAHVNSVRTVDCQSQHKKDLHDERLLEMIFTGQVLGDQDVDSFDETEKCVLAVNLAEIIFEFLREDLMECF